MSPEARSSAGALVRRKKRRPFCRRIIKEWLQEHLEQCADKAELEHMYKTFGPDPFVAAAAPEFTAPAFSAWSYAAGQIERLLAPGDRPHNQPG